MKNPNDYKAGWTTAITNPKTGKTCSGGAARNLRSAASGGVENIRVDAFLQGIAHVKPMLDQYQQQLDQSRLVLEQFQMQIHQLTFDR